MLRNQTRARRYGFVERTADGPVWVSTNQVGVFVRRPAAGEEASRTPAVIEAPPPPVSKDLKRRWSYSIRKVYETDPLVCPKCAGVMAIIIFIDQPEVIIHSKRNSIAL
jgi:hypothetical protein